MCVCHLAMTNWRMIWELAAARNLTEMVRWNKQTHLQPLDDAAHWIKTKMRKINKGRASQAETKIHEQKMGDKKMSAYLLKTMG